ncbi:MAG: hypothetical protein A2Y97_08735 [Nitrospirae bacterium RBG_13_39_12]|nr:MAG: hypothetical protein A2Y97_08735 [Nitrospirae bacterium RBG_13_39_12]
MYKLLCCISLFFFLSCSSEKPAEVGDNKSSEPAGSGVSELSTPPVSSGSGLYPLQIAPENASRNTELYIIAVGFKLSDAKIDWMVNEKITTTSDPSRFTSSELKRGDNVQVRVAVQGKEIFSNRIEIKNALPVITRVRILPEVFKPGDTLSIDASGSDADEDEVTISYEWTKNGEPAGNNRQIGAPVKRGDKVDIKITPYDGEAYGQPVILHREISNLPPMIIEDKKHNFDGNLYSQQVNANDPDGDQLTYSLKTAPSGMTIGPSTGLIKWNVPPEFEGKTTFSISVSDGHGGEATQSFNLEIKPGTRQINPG